MRKSSPPRKGHARVLKRKQKLVDGMKRRTDWSWLRITGRNRALCGIEGRDFARKKRGTSGLLAWLCLEFLLLAQRPWAENGVLARHAAAECAVKFGSQRQLAHVVVLFAAEGVSLLDQALVLETVEAGVPCLDVLRLGVVGCRGI